MHHTHATVSKTHNAALFGLHCGQLRARELVHNCGWYNQHGHKLGFGDLNLADFQRIAAEMPPGEIFLVLPEGASFWDYFYGDMHDNPGADYVAGHAVFAVTEGKIYRVIDHEPKAVTHLRGVNLLPLPREALWRKMAARQ